MSVNIITAVQQNLGYAPLTKIDPNTQQPKDDSHQFGQAAIPAVITALYRFVQTDEGAAEVLEIKNSTNWTGKIFQGNKAAVVQTVASYADASVANPVAKMNEIANETIRTAKQNLPANAGIKDVKTFFSNQRSNILPYLPASLMMGEFLDDNTLDDTTNKMEGPISSMMQSIGSAFTNPVTEDDMQAKQ